MPTGYTAAVVDGKQTEFADFAISCARAFGALITMRDDPMDAPVPEEFRPSTWNAERLVQAQAKLEQLRAMTPEQAEAAAVSAYETGCADADRYDAQQAEEDRRLDAMLEKVNAWTPPTADHVQMKAFMVEQLTISKHGDYKASRPKKLNGQDWLEAEIKLALRNVEYHAAEQAKEEERAKGRTAWVAALRASLNK
jgi:hypothetical protein